uniref:Uncharacterized protein n=1 Tax=Picea glauca TaxID=3330 RepID=A0A101M3P6_PICGL|nr:hypothetical protein ABT39_MTgene329 [Picea glauca]QHR90670.1 hypothetical protein Q903MT_gene4695 [Picea sitchensis]
MKNYHINSHYILNVFLFYPALIFFQGFSPKPVGGELSYLLRGQSIRLLLFGYVGLAFLERQSAFLIYDIMKTHIGRVLRRPGPRKHSYSPLDTRKT